MSCLRILLVIFCAGLLASCSSSSKDIQQIVDSPIHAKVIVGDDVDFSIYKTWDFMPLPPGREYDPRIDNPEFKRNLADAVEREMFTKGYRRSKESPDLVINVHATIERVTQEYIDEHYDGTYYPEYKTEMEGNQPQTVEEWHEGTVIFFIFDAKTREMIYRSGVQAEVTPDNDIPVEQTRERLAKAAKLLMEKIPHK